MSNSEKYSGPLEGHLRVDSDFNGLAFNLQEGLFIPDTDEVELELPNMPFVIEEDV